MAAVAPEAPPRPAQPSRRGVELLLLVFAAGLVTAALVLVEADQDQQLSPQLGYLGLGYLALFAVAHVVVRRTAPYADPLILPAVALLNGLGLVMIHRLDLAGVVRATELGKAIPSADAPKQMAWTAVSVVLLGIALWRIRDHRSLSKYAYTLGLGGLVLLVLPGILPASISQVNGAKLWLRLGPFSIQPGEFAKIMIIVFVAAFLVSKRELFQTAGRHILGMDLPRLRDLAPLLVAWGLAIGVLSLERELGASLLIFGVVLAMVYTATSRLSWVIIGLLFFAGGSVLSYFAFAHVRTRVEVWMDPGANFLSAGYQVSQSLFGLGTGGMGGTGLGEGRPDLVPLANADFIASGIGEELGLFGLTAVLVLYLLLIIRGLKTALVCRDAFGTLLATGLAATIGLQVFIVVGGITNLIPETGLTTPFLSYGGSSLLANYVLVALLLRISDAAGRPVATPRRPAVPIADAATEMVARPEGA
ncbi:FtsW/RodA/SpoVE family cell cycle protein [Pseudonocardia acidicola]|uniref:FtsW/RodA/SpoVE family cell cycle protein n=1 Tax=Pseudonocardia acidicola TaxID=2724939 RepID=A0ABX1SLC2_9PSEU|nr:FtsW/RodA/SpoVE family cell cycle protein [Pseudonocardia acidicola]NMI01851.1 FtsW/RodA/SpoVE family cell cycle protein [Pseudonocardia acidicola]